MNNLKCFRELSQIKPETFSKILMIQKIRYLMMERGTRAIPDWIAIMLSRVYEIDKDLLFKDPAQIHDTELEPIRSIANIDPSKREITIANRLSGKNHKRIYASAMQEIKDSIIKEIKENGASL